MYKALKIIHKDIFFPKPIAELFAFHTYLNFFNERVAIYSDNKNMIDRINNFYYYFIDDKDGSESQATILFYTNRDDLYFSKMAAYYNLPDKPSAMTLFSFDHFSYYFNHPELQYFFTGVHTRNYIIHKLFDRFIFLHGAALSGNDKTFLLPGAAAVGKTTISYFLLKRGFKLITDDLIMMSKTDFQLYPFPVLLNFRESTIQNLNELSFLKNKEPDVSFLNEKRWFYKPNKNEIENRILSLNNVFIISPSEEFKTSKTDKLQFIFNMLPHLWLPINSPADLVGQYIHMFNMIFNKLTVLSIASNDFHKTGAFIDNFLKN